MSSRNQKTSKRKYGLLLVLVVVVGVIIAFLMPVKKSHQLNIYLVHKLDISEAEANEIIKQQEPVLTEADIVAYNKTSKMIFLSEEVIEKYNKDKEEVNSSNGESAGSVILGTDDNSSSFIIAFDAKPIMIGTVRRSIATDYVPANFFIKDGLEGLQIYRPSWAGLTQEKTKQLEQSADTLANAFEQMDKLTTKQASPVETETTLATQNEQPVTTVESENNELASLLNKLLDSTDASSSSAVIQQNQEVYQQIIKQGDQALDYILAEFAKSNDDGLKEQIMAQLCIDLIGNTAKVGDYSSGREWYNKYSNRKVINIDNYKYKGKRDFEKLLFNITTPEKQDESFYIITYRNYGTTFEASFSKTFVGLAIYQFKLYQDKEGNYLVYLLDDYLLPKKIIYKERAREVDTIDFVNIVPESNSKDYELNTLIETLIEDETADTRLDDIVENIQSDNLADYSYAIKALLEQHMLANNIDKYTIISNNDVLSGEVNRRKSEQFAYFDQGIFINTSGDEDRELTTTEIESVNKLFETYVTTSDHVVIGKPIYDGVDSLNSITHVLSSYYSDVKDINIEALVYYMPRTFNVSQEEFEQLKTLENFPYKNAETLDETVTPVGKIPYEKVNETLQTYLNTSLDQLNGVGKEMALYMDEPYNAFYSVASDFGPGLFMAESGSIQADTVTLVGIGNDEGKSVLKLQKSGDKFYITSFEKSKDNN